jgi:hypothetical protein
MMFAGLGSRRCAASSARALHTPKRRRRELSLFLECNDSKEGDARDRIIKRTSGDMRPQTARRRSRAESLRLHAG